MRKQCTSFVDYIKYEYIYRDTNANKQVHLRPEYIKDIAWYCGQLYLELNTWYVSIQIAYWIDIYIYIYIYRDDQNFFIRITPYERKFLQVFFYLQRLTYIV